jgi:glycogen debranching enzyme
MDTYGDVDGDGFVEYRGDSERGLVQQGWKDSHDSVFHADGSDAPGPIALCEVQGYAYWAKRRAAEMCVAIGELDRSAELDKSAQSLRDEFERLFWSDDLGTYALALDGKKRPCLVRSSNAGQCLISGIASPERAQRVITQLMIDASFSGWGVRTIPTTEARYGPISYHNGSVWPHDNALIAQGFARYQANDAVHRVMTSMLDASMALEFHRLPELFCGFPRRPGQGPIWYPLSCAPQSWAAGSVFMFLSACLGIEIDALKRQVRLVHPSLPPFLNELRIEGLRAGDALIDLNLHRYPDDVAVNVPRRDGDIEVVVVK